MTIDIDEILLKCGMLQELKANSKKYSNVKDSKNLLATFEQHIFVWHDACSCILTAEIKNLEVDENVKKITNCTSDVISNVHSFKTLILTNPPLFDVESISFNQTGSLLALSGKFGVVIYEVPWRYGKFRSAGLANETIIGRSWNIAEMFFSCTNRVQVIQTTWHPGSPSKTHITVLCTDNYIRFYDVNDPQAPEQAISLGVNSGSSFLSSDSKIPFSSCYGESAVSFDFGPPESMQVLKATSSRASKEYESKIIWPIFLVHGNGDVYILKAPLKKEKVHTVKLEGPLGMYPAAEDNYGFDACAILCLHSTPTTLVIATATGTIYHCLVLDNSSSNEEQEHKLGLTLSEAISDECDESLYVFESVELPLSLTEDQDDAYTIPIRLHKDIISNCKYHCTHVSGLHSVAILLLPFLETLAGNSNTDSLRQILTDQQKHSCIVEHILCTKPFSQMKAVPVLGLDSTVVDGEIILVCLLASWEFVSFPVVSSFLPPAPRLLSKESFSEDQEKCPSSNFEKSLEQALQRSLCSPYVKSLDSNGENTSPQQWLDLLCNVTQRFREDYIQRLTTAQALLRSRVKVLAQQKQFQLNDVDRCEKEKDTLQLGVERLAEKYDEVQNIQQNLQKRIENILKKLVLHVPYLSQAEVEMKQTLLGYEDKIKAFQAHLDQIKKKLKHQEDEAKHLSGISNTFTLGKEVYKKVPLNDTQIKHVKELLSQESYSITNLMQNVNLTKKQLGLG